MVINRLSAYLLIVLAIPLSAHATIFQPEGETYSIAEPDFRSFIQERLTVFKTSGAFKKFKTEAIERVKKSVQRPKPLPLTTITQGYQYVVSPEIVVNKDIRLPSGQLIAAQGTRINPMNYVEFNKALIFFNADDETQLRWIAHHLNDYPQAKLILTGGDVSLAAERLGRIYFDQKGHLTHRLAIKHVPAIATQKETQWQIVIIGSKELQHG